MTDVSVTWQRAENGNVIVTGKVTRDGKAVPIDWPVVIVNPPVLVPDGDGVRHDPDEAIRQTIRDLAKGL